MRDILRHASFATLFATFLSGCATQEMGSVPSRAILTMADNRDDLAARVAVSLDGKCVLSTNQRMSSSDYKKALQWRTSNGDEPGYAQPIPAFQQATAPYPLQMLANRVEGAVRVLLFIADDGSVADVRAVCATDDAFVPGALEALRHNRYQPATLNGKPIRDIAFQVVLFHF
jgi:hypothetical protein